VGRILDTLLDAPLFRDRFDAGRTVAALLPGDLGPGTAVVGLARGGVQVAAEIAVALDAELDVVAVRKVRHPYQPEYALGAVTPGAAGAYVRSHDGLSDAQVARAVTEAQREADRLDALLHATHPPLDLAGRPVVLVDDGLATGATMIAAARWVRSRAGARIVAAVPVAARQSVEQLLAEVDLLFCPHVRADLYAVGIWYADFSPVSDGDVLRLLDQAGLRSTAATGAG
jgi:putative phosphoribosyl transferase